MGALTTASTGFEKREGAGWSLLAVVSETFRGFRADRGLDLAASLAFASLLTAVPLLVAFSLGSVPEPDEPGSVIVQDVSTPDPGKSVMVYSIAGQPGTVIWLLDSVDDS